MGNKTLFNTIAYGKRLSEKVHGDDVEYGRKAALLTTLAFLAIIMLTLFSIVSSLRGDHIHSMINAVVLILIVAGFLHMRLTGDLAVTSYLFLCLLGAQFLSDFMADSFRAMWSFTMPLLFFFLLGTRKGMLFTSTYLLIEFAVMTFIKPLDYPLDFKIRFTAIYLCITLFSYFFERVRRQTHGKLEAAIFELKELSSRNDAILGAIPDIIMEVDNDKIYTWANKAGIAFFGDDVIGKEAACYFEGQQETYQSVAPIFSGNNELMYVESLQRRRDGEKRLLAWWCRALKDGQGNVIGALSSARDITEFNRLEQQLRQTQKMDAIGQLAGGIAHDFNNQLSAISGFAELIRAQTQADDDLRRYADMILLTSQRTSELTAQLLAFSRKGKVLTVTTDLHKILLEIVNILSHTIDKRIAIRQRLNAAPSLITCDPSQIQNALLNIALNARDAMPAGGELIFETERMTLDKKTCDLKSYDISPGEYIRVCVSDSGTGMDAETMKHLFEPFFTTKEKGKGTGMGLAAVYGIVKNHKGAIDIYSEPGHGATFKLYFPASPDQDVADPLKDTATLLRGKKLNILFVDDESAMRIMAERMLESFGHHPVIFENGKEAVEYYRESWQNIDLVILDMIMPAMGGKEAFVAMRAINPGIRAILSSGYSINGEAQRILNEGVIGFVQKPFRFEQMAKAINEAVSAK